MFKKKTTENTSADMTPEEREAIAQMLHMPDEMPLDLTKAEKLRSTALLMAIQYVEKTICNDAQMYRELKMDGKRLIPATTPYVIQSAIQFEHYLLGGYDSKRQELADKASDAPERGAVPSAPEQEPVEA